MSAAATYAYLKPSSPAINESQLMCWIIQQSARCTKHVTYKNSKTTVIKEYGLVSCKTNSTQNCLVELSTQNCTRLIYLLAQVNALTLLHGIVSNQATAQLYLEISQQGFLTHQKSIPSYLICETSYDTTGS